MSVPTYDIAGDSILFDVAGQVVFSLVRHQARIHLFPWVVSSKLVIRLLFDFQLTLLRTMWISTPFHNTSGKLSHRLHGPFICFMKTLLRPCLVNLKLASLYALSTNFWHTRLMKLLVTPMKCCSDVLKSNKGENRKSLISTMRSVIHTMPPS